MIGTAGGILTAVSVDTYLCPGCDQDVPVGSRGCPRCHPESRRPKRRKARRSWEQDPRYDGLDLPGAGRDYDHFVAREFGHPPHRRTGLKWYWWATAVILLVLIVLAGFSLAGWGRNVWK